MHTTVALSHVTFYDLVGCHLGGNIDPDRAGKKLVRYREADICKLACDGHDVCDLRFHGVRVAEGGGEQAFKKIVLPKVVVTLIVDSK